MPYNTAAILPREEPTGTVQLPLTRVKKIIALDPDINTCSNNAAFVITLATEVFIQHLSEQAHIIVRSEKKPRKIIQYRDLAAAVSRSDNLEFLSDIIPKTTTYKALKERGIGMGNTNPSIANITAGSSKNSPQLMAGGRTLENGQAPMTSNGATIRKMTFDGTAEGDDDDEMDTDPNTQLQQEGAAHSAYQAAAPEVPRRDTQATPGSSDEDMS